MDNYMEYKLSKMNARLKPDVVPHLFSCQPDKEISSKRVRTNSEKRSRKKMLTELIHKQNIEEGTGVVEDMSILPEEKYNDERPLVFPLEAKRYKWISSQKKKMQQRRP